MSKKRLLLRIDPALHNDLRGWADDDFRSMNAQIEFLLKQAVSKRKRDEQWLEPTTRRRSNEACGCNSTGWNIEDIRILHPRNLGVSSLSAWI